MSSMLRGKSHKARGKPPAAAAQSTRDAAESTPDAPEQRTRAAPRHAHGAHTAAPGARAATDAPAARYEQVKHHIRGIIESGARQAGERLPSELDLVATLGVSRMTVNRALRELTHEGLVTRVSGVGTFVAQARPQSTLLMIAHIGDEIRSRGHEYSYRTVLLQRETASVVVSNALGLAPAASVFHVVCVHRENGLPVQLEDRYVNPAIAPDFLQQDFSTIRPSEYLFETVPAHDVEHIVDAGLPTQAEAGLLEIRAEEPCLTLVRRTWTSGVAVTFARFVHPGSRYRLGCRFVPDMSQRQG